MLHTIMDNIGVKSESQLLDKLEKTLKEHTDLQQSVVSLQTQLLHTTLQSISSPHHDVFDMIVVVDTYEHLQSVDFKDIVNATKQFFEQKNVLVYANS
ncbi:hypothetical protein GW750_09060 [bacterium]|nr:hypothetical protein [bacterium]